VTSATFRACQAGRAKAVDDLGIADGRRHRGGVMSYIGIGVVLLVLGWLLGISILWILGVIAIVVGLVFYLTSFGAYAGSRPWYHRRYW
jgi:hypothetical protein